MVNIMDKNKEMWDEEQRYGSRDITYSGKAHLDGKYNLSNYLKLLQQLQIVT